MFDPDEERREACLRFARLIEAVIAEYGSPYRDADVPIGRAIRQLDAAHDAVLRALEDDDVDEAVDMTQEARQLVFAFYKMLSTLE